MIEIIKEAATLLKDLPDLAIWILVGILFYKVFIIGGTISLIRFIVTKIHDVIIGKGAKLNIDGYFIYSDGSKDKLLYLLSTIKRKDLTYIHSSDIDELQRAWDEYCSKKKDV